MKKFLVIIMIIAMQCISIAPCAYAANSAITRSSFCYEIIETLGIEYDVSELECPFTDLNVNDSYYSPCMIMYDLGYLDGYKVGLFKPTYRMTNAGVAKALTKMLFGDFDVPDDVDLVHSKYAWKAKEAGLMIDIDDSAWDNPAYENSINFKLIKEMITEVKDDSATVSLDLSKGSIRIQSTGTVYDLFGAKDYIQGDTVIRSVGNCIIRQSDVSESTSSCISVSDVEVSITLANVNIDAYSTPVSVSGKTSLSLNLIGDNTVVAGNRGSGISVDGNSSVAISGPGKITTIGGDYVPSSGGAGAGGYGGGGGGNFIIIIDEVDSGFGDWRADVVETYEPDEPGKIIINSGTVTATSGNIGAGIGSSTGSGIKCEEITINGGTVIATSDTKEGISGKKITINGGTVAATGGTNGAGIGGSYAEGSIVSIKNASVTAKGYYNGIGGGSLDNKDGCRSIAIINSEMNVSHIAENGCDYQERIFSPTVTDALYVASNGGYALPSTYAYGASGISYQWQESADDSTWKDVEGQISATASIRMTNENDGYYYRCKLVNGWGNVVYTDSARCVVFGFSKQPQSVIANINDMVSFEAEPLSGGVTYQWEASYDAGKTYKTIDGEIYSTLIVTATALEHEALYRCVITANSGDKFTSDVAKLLIESELSLKDAKYIINTIILRDATSKQIVSKIPNADFIAEVSVANLSSINTDAIIVVAYGKNGTVQSIYYIPEKIKVDKTVNLSVMINNANGKVTKVKAFVWSALDSQEALAEPIEIVKQ